MYVNLFMQGIFMLPEYVVIVQISSGFIGKNLAKLDILARKLHTCIRRWGK